MSTTAPSWKAMHKFAVQAFFPPHKLENNEFPTREEIWQISIVNRPAPRSISE